MRKRIMILATVLAVLMVVSSGGWWVWREYYSADEVRVAIESNDFEYVEILLFLGARVDKDDKLLRRELVKGSLDLARLLVAHGAKVDTKDGADMTPLHWALFRGDADLAQLMLNKGADVNAKNNRRRTPLHFAVLGDYLDGAKLLLANGANVDSKDNFGYTPLHRAAAVSHLEIIELLLENGAKVDAQAQTLLGYTPLHWIVYANKPSMVKLFLANGADLNIKTNTGQTPLDIAIKEGHTKTADLLKAHMTAQEPPDRTQSTADKHTVYSFRKATLSIRPGLSSKEVVGLFGVPAHIVKVDNDKLLTRFDATDVWLYFHPEYATVSCAVGFQNQKVTKAMIYKAWGTRSPIIGHLVAIDEFWASENSTEAP